jgi:serine/threonine protein kinase
MARPNAEDRGLAAGTVLAGKYRLNLALGEGGMATVWSAYHLELDIPVAIKLLRAGHDPHLAQRLKLEARAAVRVVHPAIARVLDVASTENGDPFIVMDLLTGETLADLLVRERISAVRVVQLLLPIIDGLGAAHTQGVVHRDLKPANVFLDTRGGQLQPKVLDFGIAKLTGGCAVKLTEAGVTLGSPSYMSPEQARGDEVDFRSDIWSLCVLLYKAIGGKVPFRGPDTRAILDAILEKQPPPLPLGAGVDGNLSRIILSGLSKDPAARPASMRQLGQRLARWLLLHGVATDACGTPLVSKWLSSDPPPKPSEESTGPVTRRFASPPPPSPKGKPAPLRTPRPVAPVARRSGAPAKRKLGLATPQRRWMLWALAGMLVAGGSLALTRSVGPKSAARSERSRVLVAADVPVAAAPLPHVETILAVAEDPASASRERASEPIPASKSSQPAAAAASQGGARPAKDPPRSVHRTLPF